MRVIIVGCGRVGAYLAKDLLLNTAGETGQWWWVVVIQAGGILTSAYVILVLAHALSAADTPITLRMPTPRLREAAPLALALCSLVLGLVPWEGYLPIPHGIPSDPFTLETLVTCSRILSRFGSVSSRPDPTHSPPMYMPHVFKSAMQTSPS